ncbi:NAD(P)-dependent oxidoreductase [Acetobacter pasteurianus]|uniref:Putative oxidoreductase n=1 Tax=Acetobacter pasteurianus TaxID=438 RepID=A0A1A0CF14_ACEPA|nr:glucose 1-dehydrogenase [Acetobacter pasteurianus]OAZ61549.1 putative oxidoreductase [Acetobacter pasteurianus]RCL06244.1 NAD(P)-dependent oxidoreductase [Acetobacter pasteurianus]GAB31364.1 dehydrogenase [Acetobacter pasteurianus subsp. pasteurianus LMG 1262 = NBRC 106471]GCD50407.1 dehydrogenase [Acetobacter pasteurianus subsp. pasteurianus LMG 1262 = NBRC 106471]
MMAHEEKISPQHQTVPGETDKMNPIPDHGEKSYQGSGKLSGKVALITGADSGIGRSVAIAFAREGADIAIAYYTEDNDAQTTADWVEKAGRRAILLPGDIRQRSHCNEIIKRTIDAFGQLDILVNNAAHQKSVTDISEIDEEELDTTFRTNFYGMFFLCQAALPYLSSGSSIINTTSINAVQPSPHLPVYAATKAAISNFTAGLAQMLGKKDIRVNAVAPGPVWTPLIPSTMPQEDVANFGKNTPIGRPAQPAELASAYVMFASDQASYTTGAVLPITGGRPML